MSKAESHKTEGNFVTNDLDLAEIFPFSLDDFQLEAIDSLNLGHSVVVSAPTGSGKTLIGEYAIYRAISHGQKVFYTTPLKALSNQKLRDFRKQFGAEHVGLMTGDLSVNRDASVVVMTTEIFRNMLYAESDQKDDPLCDVEAVVLDECHYMNDSQRGTVWEESIIHCPSSVQLVALSATVANAGQLTDWIQQVHGPTDLISSDFRPVPLDFKFCSAKGIHPLLNEKRTGLHSSCKVWRPPKGIKRRGKINKPLQPEAPSIDFVVRGLAERKMLPAIYFIFSRRGCDRALKDISKMNLVTSEEKKQIQNRLRLYIAANPDGVRDGIHSVALLRGMASHHAGVLPAWKELIEELFQSGLVKVVFATETLAAGINMPARTTVISTLSKRAESGHRLLKGSEFLQMAGRAGRRGLDKKGFVVSVQSRFEGVREAGAIATSEPDPLASQFTPSYGMVLNLLQRYDLSKSRELVQRSFGCYLATLDLVDDEDSLEKLKDQLIVLEEMVGDISWNDFEDYEKRRCRLREERRLLKILQKQASETLANELTLALQFASIGTLVSIKTPQFQNRITPAVIVQKRSGPGKFPILLCLTAENVWILLACPSVVSLYAEITCLDMTTIADPGVIRLGDISHGDSKTNIIAKKISELANIHDMTTPQYDLASEVLLQSKLVSNLELELQQLPVHKWGDRKKIKKHQRKVEELKKEINDRQNFIYHRSNSHWDRFLSLLEILKYFGCLVDSKLTDIGRTVAVLRGDNELWIGLALMSGHFDDLDPSELSGVIEAIGTDVSRRNLWSGFLASHNASQALSDLSAIRRELLRTQDTNQVDIPIWYDSELIGLVEAWARGATWTDLMANTSLDEGDVVRILRRTVDLLSQIPHCEAISQQLRTNARSALKAINRFPVREAEDLFTEYLKQDPTLNPATQRSI